MSTSALAPVQNVSLQVGTSAKATSSKFASAVWGLSVRVSRRSERLPLQAVSVVAIRRVRVVDVRASADGSGEEFGKIAVAIASHSSTPVSFAMARYRVESKPSFSKHKLVA